MTVSRIALAAMSLLCGGAVAILSPASAQQPLAPARSLNVTRDEQVALQALQAAAAGLSEGRFCWSDKGIPLISSFKSADGSWSMEATSVSTTVPDSDFTLPAQPVKYP